MNFLPFIVAFIRFNCKAILFFFCMLFFSCFAKGSFCVLLFAFDNRLAHDDNLLNLEDYATWPPILRLLIGVGAVQTTI